MEKKVVLLAYLALALILPGIVSADSSPMVVGEDGIILKLRNGIYGDLFPGEAEADASNSVLALDVQRSSGTERYMVPNTESREAERVSTLYFGKDSGLTYLLWEGLVNGAHPFVNLTSFDGSSWSEVIAIAGSVYADKGPADLVIVPESDPVPKASPSFEMPSKRTVIYVAWQEIAPSGGSESFLVPIILEEGEYIGWRQIYNLSGLLPGVDGGHGENTSPPVFDPNLQSMLRIQASAKGNAIVVGFISLETGRFVTLEFDMLPLALGAMAQRVRELIPQLSQSASDIKDLIGEVQEAILADGSTFHPSVLEYLASEVGELLAEYSSVEAATAPLVLDKVGAYMINVGARVRRKGMVDLEPLGIHALGQTPSGGAPYHYLKVSLVAERDAPLVEGRATLFLSRTGEQALVTWAAESAIRYRETEGDAWGETQQIELREGLDQEAVYKILSEPTMNR